MKMRIDIARAAELLRENDDILVLCHAHPDGDTLGCGYALMHMLQSLGKRCRLECADEIAPKYSFMLEGLADCGDFDPKFITAVDVADIKLLSTRRPRSTAAGLTCASIITARTPNTRRRSVLTLRPLRARRCFARSQTSSESR